MRLVRRRPRGDAELAALQAARATRFAAALLLVGTIVSAASEVAIHALDRPNGGPESCVSQEIRAYVTLLDDGLVTKDEFDSLRSDAIADELSDTGTGC